MQRFTSGFLLAAVVPLLLQACQFSPNPDRITVRDPNTNERDFPDLTSGLIDRDLIGLSDYALLAEAAYHGGPADRSICPAVSAARSTWRPVEGYSETEFFPETPSGRIKIPGIGYRLWKKVDQARLALVFRGTDFREPGDWYSNLRWGTRINQLTWDQYDQTRHLIQDIIPKIERQFGKNTEIVAVGHSLGGGLAQQAAYSTTHIGKVYAFATSPVTGAASISPFVTPENKRGDKVFRIYEAGEILAGVRWASRVLISLSRENPKIMELRFNFRSTLRPGSPGGGPLGQHSMLQLACDMICRVDEGRSADECRKPVPSRTTRATPH